MNKTRFFTTFTIVLILMLLMPANSGLAIPPEPENGDKTDATKLTCTQSSKTLPSSHPFSGVTFKEKKDITGEDKDKITKDVQSRADVKNVLKDQAFTIETAESKVVKHTLGDGNTLLAVGFTTEKNILVYYEAETPLVKHLEQKSGGARDLTGDEYIYKSQAALFDAKLEMITFSINGQPVGKPEKGVTTQSSCTYCIDIYNWYYYSGYCASYDGSCMVWCCVPCGVTCSGGVTPPCLACVFLYCPTCAMWRCCNRIEYGCVYCG